MKVWDRQRRGEVIRTLTRTPTSSIRVAFRPDGRHLASAGADRQRQGLGRDDRPGGLPCPGYVGVYYGTAYGVAFSPDGRRLAAGNDGAVNIWDGGTAGSSAASPDTRDERSAWPSAPTAGAWRRGAGVGA